MTEQGMNGMKKINMNLVVSLTILMAGSQILCGTHVVSNAKADEGSGWQAIPLIRSELQSIGLRGGEGGQWPQALESDADGKFLLMGTDVGGIFRSLDGGGHWEPCNVGYNARGNCGFAIDPNNPMRCLSIGANSTADNFHGLYLSTDQAASWTHVLPARINGYRDFRRQLAFDPATFDVDRKLTRIVYWSRVGIDNSQGNPEIHPGLYQSIDGGSTWSEVPDTADLGDCEIAIHPTSGVVYAAGPTGFFRYDPKIGVKEKTFDNSCSSLALIPNSSEHLLITTGSSLMISTDGGISFELLPTYGALPDKPLYRITVSQADPKHYLVWAKIADYEMPRFVTHDGGQSWEAVRIDSTNSFLPNNARQALFAWHPKSPKIAWSIGGDWISRSTDGGKTFEWQSSGYNGILIGSSFQFCAQDPNVVFFGSQDYNGALTTDSGKTWRYTNVSGNGWGGFTYGGYAASKQVLVVGDTDHWGGKRTLMVSSDGGKSWDRTKHILKGPPIAFGDPDDSKTIFASNLRSDDGGKTWKPMSGCSAVYTATVGRPKSLFGIDEDRKVVTSGDGGLSWNERSEAPGTIGDLAIDSIRRRVYAVVNQRLAIWENGMWTVVETLPKDQRGDLRILSVAVDPLDPSIVYAVSNRDVFMSSTSVVRSRDAGQTWQVLTVQKPLKDGQQDGGREAFWVRVHPVTRDAWVAASCMGLWRYVFQKEQVGGDQ